jgi:hypothetical protein
MGLDHIDIYSFNFNMHSGLYKILWDLAGTFRGVGLKSQRFDLLAHDPQMVEFQHALEKASLTCGLEGISPRLRKYLHKNLETEQLHKSLDAIFKSKARELKVFLIATGLEEDQDFEALADMLDHFREIRAKAHAGTRLIFSMTPLVRFPWTPLEFEDGYSTAHYAAIIAKAAGRVRAAGFEFRESADLPEYWVSQVLVRAADPRVGQALVDTVTRTGFAYYREVPESFRAALEESLRARGLDPTTLIKGFTLEESRAKPWAAIETGVKREFLWEEVGRARLYKEIDYCLGRSWQPAKCFHCGGCPTRFHVRDIVLAQQKRDYSLEQFKDRIRAAREAETPVRLLVDAGAKSRGVPRKMLGVAIARALMLTEPALAPYYRGYGGSFWDEGSGETWVTGADALQLLWRRDAVPRVHALLADTRAREAINAKLSGWGEVQGLAEESWRPAWLEISAPRPMRPDEYLKSRALKYTLRKKDEGAYVYDFAPPSRKKGFVERLETSRRRDGGSDCLVVPGLKFGANEFLKNSCGPDWVRAQVVAHFSSEASPRKSEVIGFKTAPLSAGL